MWVCPSCCTAFAAGCFCPADGVALHQQGLQVPGLFVEREIGRGLTGTVWRAHDPAGRAVAVKVLHREWSNHGEMRERFLREGHAGAAISHPCVVAPIAAGQLDDGRPYLVMELVDGPSLDEVLTLGPLAETRALAIAIDLAAALAAVHRAGVVHRDVKPGNIRIGRDGRAHLLDFGVAKRLDHDEAKLTNGGLTVGTPHYMAPEQCSGEPVTGRTDVYALGVVLYRMLTGTVPFDGNAAVAVMLAHTARRPEPVRVRAPMVSVALERLVLRCLNKRASDRPEAATLALELAEVADSAQVDPHGKTRQMDEQPAARLGRASTVPAEDLVPLEPVPPQAVRRITGRPTRPLPPTESSYQLPTSSERRPAPGRASRRVRTVAMLAMVMTVAVALLGTTGLDAELGLDLGLPRVGAAAATPRTIPTPPPPEVAGPQVPRRYLMSSNDGVALRLGAPERIAPKAEHELTLEAWDDDGRPLDTNDLVVTFAGPGGAVIGLAAEPTRTRGLYRVRTRFDRRGEWVISVFPPVGDAMVTFHVDVGDVVPNS